MIHDGSSRNRLSSVAREAYLVSRRRRERGIHLGPRFTLHEARFTNFRRFTLHERRFTRKSSDSAVAAETFMNNAD
jgi:hypothetical protein